MNPIRQIGKNLAIYLGSAWVVMEAFNFFIERYDLEPLLLDILILLIVFGVLSTVVYSYFSGRWNKVAICLHTLIVLSSFGSVGYFIINPLKINPRALRFIEIGGRESPLKDLESIAILPIQNNLLNQENDYLLAGLHDGIITELGKFGNLKTISRTSTLPYAETTKSLKQIGSELDVHSILESALSPSDDEYIYRVRLLDTDTEELLWSDEFQTNVAEFPRLYDELANIIATKLNPGPIENIQISKDINPEAYVEILKGNNSLQKFSKKYIEESIVHFKKAIEIDSTIIEGYLGVASSWVFLQQLGIVDPKIARPNIYYYGDKAVAIDSNHWQTLGYLSYRAGSIEYDIERAIRLNEKSVALNPNSSYERSALAYNYMLAQEMEKAWEQIRYAKEIDPLNPQVMIFEAILLFNDNKMLSGMKLLEKLSLIDNSSMHVKLTNVIKYRDFGLKDTAIKHLKILYEDATSDTAALNRFIDEQYEKTNDVSLTWLAVLRYFKTADFQKYYPSRVAVILYNLLPGYDDDLFFECLSQMARDRDPNIPQYAMRKDNDLQKDPRYIKIMQEVGLW